MEKLCKIRDLQRSIIKFETNFQKQYGICLNEGMLLCTLLQEGKLSSSQIGEHLGLSHSNTSKVIKSVEEKELIQRVIGDKDKRQMYFSLSKKGEQVIHNIHCSTVGIPEKLEDFI